jgi:hypothetical protein
MRLTWTMRTKPRSAIRTVEWFRHFAAVAEGRNWDLADGRGQRPVRRAYVRAAHPELDLDAIAEPESNARQDKSIFECFGLAYQEPSGVIRVTPAGRALIAGDDPDEIMLRQLLKWQFPSLTHGGREFAHMGVLPFEVLLRTLDALGEVSRLEIAGTFFTCLRREDLPDVVRRVRQARNIGREPGESEERYATRVCRTLNPELQRPRPPSLLDMADAFTRFAEYTGLVVSSGRSLYTRVRVPERSQLKFRQLLAAYPFRLRQDHADPEAFLAHFGDPYAVELPWDRPESLAEHVRQRAEALRALLAQRRASERQLALDIDPDAVLRAVESAEYAELRQWNRRLEAGLIGEREREFVSFSARTDPVRAEIVAKFDEILSGSDDDAARWLEVNTWRSLVALEGDHTVVRRFGLEEDLSPRSFAPGIGNTPDMEFYSPRIVLVPEVSLMSGVRQWTHEGAAVVDHVFRLIGDHGDDARPVIGLFIAPTLHERTLWQFFILNQQSWRGEPVPVIPLEVGVWRDLLAHAYDARLPAQELEELIFRLHRAAYAARDFTEWRAEMARRIGAWKAGRPQPNHLPARQTTLPLGEV